MSTSTQTSPSRICAAVLGAKSGETVVDTCACPGGKTFSAALDMENNGIIYAFDLHKNKLSLVEKGATVKIGQPLVGAYFLAGEQSFPTVPAAEIIIRAEFAFSLEVSAADERAIAAVIAVAKEKCPETNIIEQNYTVSEVDSGFLVTVTLTYFKRIGG